MIPDEPEKYNILTSSVVECLTECNLPLSLVDNPPFLKMLSKFFISNRNYLIKLIL